MLRSHWGRCITGDTSVLLVDVRGDGVWLVSLNENMVSSVWWVLGCLHVYSLVCALSGLAVFRGTAQQDGPIIMGCLGSLLGPMSLSFSESRRQTGGSNCRWRKDFLRDVLSGMGVRAQLERGHKIPGCKERWFRAPVDGHYYSDVQYKGLFWGRYSCYFPVTNPVWFLYCPSPSVQNTPMCVAGGMYVAGIGYSIPTFFF